MSDTDIRVVHDHVSVLARRLDAVEDRVDDAEDGITNLERDMAVLKEMLGNTATRQDMAELRLTISEAYSAQATKALDAVPAKLMVWLTAGLLVVGAVAALGAILALRH